MHNQRLRTLASGNFKLKAWGEMSVGPLTQTVSIDSGENAVTLDVPGRALAADLGEDKFGVARGKAP